MCMCGVCAGRMTCMCAPGGLHVRFASSPREVVCPSLEQGLCLFTAKRGRVEVRACAWNVW